LLKVKAQAGDMLRQMREAREMNWGVLKRGTELPRSHDATTELPTLSSIGISKPQSPPPGTDHGR